MFNRFIYRREWSFRIYRETLSRFSCAASLSSRWATAPMNDATSHMALRPSTSPSPSPATVTDRTTSTPALATTRRCPLHLRAVENCHGALRGLVRLI
ncbi:hypothetical protein ABLN67_06600 [Mycobacterium tuberculosis]